MARLLPFRPSDTSIEPRRPRLVELDDDEADSVFAALSAETARDILGQLYRERGTATDVAEAADTSLQNARYHLEKLQNAGLVEAVDTWYSSRGTEMTVYAPTNEPLVVAAGPDEETNVLRSALGRLVGALGILGIASLLVDRLARFGLGGLLPVAQSGGADGGSGDAAAETEFEMAAEAANATTTPSPTPVAESTGTVTETVAREATATGTPVVEETVVATRTPAATELAASPSPTPEATSVPTTAVTPTEMAGTGPIDLGAGLPPGGLFFLGGLVVIAAVAGWWYWRRYRPMYGSPS